MVMTPKQFVEKYNGRGIDWDGAYGIQCVDAFKLCCQLLGIPVKATPNNWADGYWLYRNQLGFDKYFDYVTGSQNFKNGDWVIWKQKSASHPSSHIAMYYNGKEFGQNQGGNRYFNLKATNFTDALGALRPKVWAKISGGTTVKPLKQINATSPAKAFNNKFTGTYKVIPAVGLNMRYGAGTNQKVMVTLPANHKVNCYGYYTNSSGTRWLYVTTIYKEVSYTGFTSANYLKKE